MTKKIDIGSLGVSGVGTTAKWYKSSDVELLNNTGNTDIRVDKLMLQTSGYHTGAVSAWVVAYIVHLTDETGATLSASVTSGTTDDAAMELLLNQWKDNVFMTDLRIMGMGMDENLIQVVSLEANTRRILKPGQKLYLTALVQPQGSETTKNFAGYFDSILWYSAAAQ